MAPKLPLFDPRYDAEGHLLGMKCRRCAKWLPIDAFYRTKRGHNHWHRTCKFCFSKDNWHRYEAEKRDRKDPAHRARFLVKDSRASDKRRGLANNLIPEWVDAQIRNGCSYCTAKDLLMSLDRVDNSLGHTKANVIACCIRCNFIRGTMPYEAWRCLIPGVRRAYKLGLFGTWTGAFHKSGPRRKNVAVSALTKAEAHYTDLRRKAERTKGPA